MSRVVGRDDVGFLLFLEPCFTCRVDWQARTATGGGVALLLDRSLTVPLLCWGCGLEVEGGHEVEGGLAQFQAFDRGPQVDDVALNGAVGMEALEDVFFKMG